MTTRTTLRLPPALHRLARETAAARGVTLNELTVRALHHYLDLTDPTIRDLRITATYTPPGWLARLQAKLR